LMPEVFSFFSNSTENSETMIIVSWFFTFALALPSLFLPLG
jgi:hypothetical protein